MIELLESRQLLSAFLKSGLLSVRGTPSDDRIKVVGVGERIVVSINGHRSRFRSDRVDSIRIDASAGDDHVDARNLWPNNTVLGGAGNDILLGSSHSQLDGGSGDNRLKRTNKFLILPEDLVTPAAAVDPVAGPTESSGVSYGASFDDATLVRVDGLLTNSDTGWTTPTTTKVLVSGWHEIHLESATNIPQSVATDLSRFAIAVRSEDDLPPS